MGKIEELVKERMLYAGLTQAKLAELSGCTANQMGLFLKGAGFLNKTSLEKCLAVLGVRLDIYSKRFQLAKEAAIKLKDLSRERVLAMTKKEMATITDLPEILCFFDVSESQLDNILNSRVVDYEGTYPYFKAIVLHLMQIGSKPPTPKTVENSFSKLSEVCAAFALPILGVGSVIGVATGLLLGNKILSKSISNAFTPLVILTKQILKK